MELNSSRTNRVSSIHHVERGNVDLPPNIGNRSRITRLFHRIVDKAVEKVHQIEPKKIVAKVLSYRTLVLGCSLTNIARYTANATRSFFGHEGYIMGPARLLAVVQFPLLLGSIKEDIGMFFHSTWNEKLDAFLDIVSSVGCIGDEVSTFAEGLVSAGAVTAKSIMWASPLFLVSVGLELAGIALGIKGAIETFNLRRKFSNEANLNKSVDEYGVEDFEKGCEYLGQRMEKERTFVGKFLKVDKVNLVDRLVDIQFTAKQKMEKPETKREGQEMLKKAMDALKGRFSARLASYSLLVLASTVSIVGIGILLFTPIQPLGFALLGLGAVLALSRIGFDYLMDRRFARQLELDKPLNVTKVPSAPEKKKMFSKKWFEDLYLVKQFSRLRGQLKKANGHQEYALVLQ